ncbi:MAG TPA: carbamoyltransferase HypF [Streptosporangiaceae bacterium]|nr:carbamoyltransferase HypF [Streptosporangiaceae bacterium]
MNSDAARVRRSVRVTGTVQGVGFRPFVYSLATRLGLSGFVGNDAEGVFAEVEGSPAAVGEFLVAVERDAPPLARIDQVVCTNMQPDDSPGFTIAPSAPGAQRTALVSADSAMCADCLAELRDPADRRHAYPFINCTNCGPRFTIVADVPYDRPSTTMAPFAMCEPCAAEYHDPANRRFHAQPVCCPACGPCLSLRSADGSPRQAGDPLAAAAALLRDGQVLAVKGLGGYHLAVDARSEEAAAALRARKHREDKPFAVMAAGLAEARELGEVDETAATLLASPRRPIVLLPRRPGTVAAAVAPGNRALGVMLPYTPLHHLLLEAVGGPIVLTSGNLSDEPIAYRDEDAFERLAAIADAFLTHDRAIHIRTDDSVSRVVRGREMLIRRSRGHVPEPVTTAHRFPRPVLACGAELKNTFCLAKDDRAFVSHHIGDLENAATLRSFTEGIEHFGRLFGIEPQVVAYDLHPEYLSTKYALDLDTDSCGVQHHHAHIASCLADNGHAGPVIGVAFDGTGYGTDGTLWGGEFLVADLAGFERAGHLEPVPMPGGAAAIRQPWRMAAAYLRAVFPGGPPSGLGVVKRNERNWAAITSMAERGVNAPLSSSAGRLFDAVAALLAVRDAINYEGQAAVELEQLADPRETGSYRAAISDGPPFRIQGASLVQAVTGELTEGAPAPLIAARFHNGIAALIEDGCVLARERYGLDTVALSGGVFQNLLVTERAAARLEARGFRVLLHSRVPCNDGGISLGQAVVAGARDRSHGA